MKRILIALVLLSFCFTGYAELFVIVDSNSREIYTASEKNDIIIPTGKELIILPGGWKNYEFDEALTNYKYIDGKFIKNIAKIDAEYQANVIKEEETIEEDLIQKRMRKMAIDVLELEGVVFKHVSK